MEGIWRVVAIVVVAFIAIRVAMWLFGWVMTLLNIGIALAIVVGIVWLLVTIFGRKKAYM